MAWIESHQKLERHPKTLKLMSLLKDTDNRRTPLDTVLGRLHRLWWWCLEYAENGDLQKYSIEQLTGLLDFDANALVEAGWIDTEPYLRIHDWWQYVSHFLKSKYKNYPEKWHAIEALYIAKSKGRSKGKPKTPPKPALPLPLPLPNHNLTIPNQKITEEPAKNAGTPQAAFVLSFKQTYEAMVSQPFKVGREHYVIASNLLKNHGEEATILKAKLLGQLCEGRSAWFTRDGWANYTLETLSKHWNSIIPEARQLTREEEVKIEMKRQEEMRERADRLVK